MKVAENLNRIAFPKVAAITKSLKIIRCRRPSRTPWHDIIDVKMQAATLLCDTSEVGQEVSGGNGRTRDPFEEKLPLSHYSPD